MAAFKVSLFLARFGRGSGSAEALSVVTYETIHGNLRMDIVLALPRLEEPTFLEISVRRPARVFAISECLDSWTADGPNSWRASSANTEMARARKVRAPLVHDAVSGRRTTTAYLADFGDGYRNRVPFGDVSFRVIGATSQRCLLSTRRRITATAE
jgi:hypothetical protein